MKLNESSNDQPLEKLHDWEEFVEEQVYPEPEKKQKDDYRNYDNPARESVREFYRLNHINQTFDFVQDKEAEFLPLRREEMSIFDAIDFLNTLVDDSDPDTDLDQLQHLLQTSEAIRKDGHEDWFVLTGFLHDLGKVLCLYGEPQWAVVGDTFPVGCRFSEKIVYSEFFAENPDSHDSRYNTELGVYERGCGLRNVDMSWGHDEYLYHVMKEYLPEEALYMIRYHSCYPWHRENEYDHLCDDHDRDMLSWVRKFNPYDLYSKCPEVPDWKELKPYYTKLFEKFLPGKIAF